MTKDAFQPMMAGLAYCPLWVLHLETRRGGTLALHAPTIGPQQDCRPRCEPGTGKALRLRKVAL